MGLPDGASLTALHSALLVLQALLPPPLSGGPCLSTINDLLPGSGLSVMRNLIANAKAANLSLPDPEAGFTLFATNNTGFTGSQGKP